MAAPRGVLFICCSMLEAKTIRREAQAERRTVSGYVLAIVFRILPLEERIFMVDYRRRRPRPIVFAPALLEVAPQSARSF